MQQSLDASRRQGGQAGSGSVAAVDGLPALVNLQPIDAKTLAAFYPGVEDSRYRADDLCYVTYRPSQGWRRPFEEHPDGKITIKVNGAGLREPEEVREGHPVARLLVTGDSHLSGVVPHDENLVHLIETLIEADEPGRDIESLNAGIGGYNVYNYLGVLEHFAYLQPEVFLVVVYGGNDFYDTVRLERYFAGRGRFRTSSLPNGERLDAWKRSGTVRGQETNQTRYLIDNPEDASIAATTSAAILAEIAERCELRGIVPLFAYLPPALAVQADRFPDEMKATTVALGVTEEDVCVSDAIADEMIECLTASGLGVIDLREAFRASEDLLYWKSDFHINTAGHRLAAEVLAPHVEAALAKAPADRSHVQPAAPHSR
ncbi:alginate O-acetyltransferase AlgX-related protein [Saltatorellus ferox]